METWHAKLKTFLQRCYPMYKKSYHLQTKYNLTDALEAKFKAVFPEIAQLRQSNQELPIQLPDFKLTPQQLFPEMLIGTSSLTEQFNDEE